MLQNLLCVPNYTFSKTIRQYGSGPHSETHYDTLDLKKNCSSEEIREAFIRLSKEYHPDVKGAKTNPRDTAKFVKISEAYQVLSKPVSRDSYDQDLLARGLGRTTANGGFKTTEVRRPWEIKPDYDPNPGPYYGIRGLKRVSNGKVVVVLIVFTIISAGMGFMSVRHSFTFNRSQLDFRSKEAGEHHAAVRANAEKFGNDEQLKRMVDKLVARPT